MLSIVATPIGHLKDLSLRALETLQTCDLILCEDTRRSKILLDHYGIQKPLRSYHKFNEKKRLEEVLEELEKGSHIALISDAGTPCLNDPGSVLIQACIERGVPLTSIPGACSPINALLLSGFDSTRFQFIGFLPKKEASALRQVLSYPGTTVAFESPERLVDTLEAISSLDPCRMVSVVREMTKTYEECRRGMARDVFAHFKEAGVRGEVCLVVAQGKIPAEEMPLDELIEVLQTLHGLSLKEAIKTAAKLLDRPKSEIYRSVHKIE